MRDAVQEVRRAVQRIDDPAPGPVVPARSTAFFHQEGVAGTGAAQFLAEDGFGAQVCLGNEISGTLDADLKLFDLCKVTEQTARSLLCRALHDGHVRERRMLDQSFARST